MSLAELVEELHELPGEILAAVGMHDRMARRRPGALEIEDDVHAADAPGRQSRNRHLLDRDEREPGGVLAGEEELTVAASSSRMDRRSSLSSITSPAVSNSLAAMSCSSFSSCS